MTKKIVFIEPEECMEKPEYMLDYYAPSEPMRFAFWADFSQKDLEDVARTMELHAEKCLVNPEWLSYKTIKQN